MAARFEPAQLHLKFCFTFNEDSRRTMDHTATPTFGSRFLTTFATLALFQFVPFSALAQDQTALLLEQLSNASGPSGYEEPIRNIMVEKMKPLTDKLSWDGLGSVIATQGSNGPRVMIDAHMDELGLMVRRITPDGFLTVQTLGGWLDEALVGQRWTIDGSKGPVQAVSGLRDAHLVSDAESHKLLDTQDSMYLDVGARSDSEVRRMGIRVGDPVSPDSKFVIMNGTRNYLGKAWDDRAGCAILIELMQKLAHASHPNQLFYAATVQEETGLRGGHTAADVVKPDIAIVLEAGITHDVPGAKPDEAQEVLGGGPGLFQFNSSQQPNRKFVAYTRQVAAEKNIPVQDELVWNYGDDAAEIQKSNGGVPTVTIVVPVRYTHGHNGIMNRDDYDRTLQLLLAMIQKLDATTVSQLRSFGTP
jgi:putative aminopeptidase FrvX